jgi:hypothetical protein
MKNILVVGCSYSALPTHNEYKAWTQFMGDDGYYVENFAEHGAGNLVIKRILQTKLAEKKYEFVIVQWSTIDRWDYPICVNDSPTLVRYWPNGSNLEGKTEHFYKHYYSVYGAVIDTLENILFTQQLLDSENIPYSMITIGNLFTLSTTIEQIKKLMQSYGNYYELQENVLEKMERIQTLFEDADSLPFLLKKINYDKFIFSDDERNPMGGGMLEWLYKVKNEYPKSNWHFDGKQSYDFLNEFIKPKILIPNGLI